MGCGSALDALGGEHTIGVYSMKDGVDVFDSIYEAMAADIHAPQATTRIGVEAAQEYAHEVRSGVNTGVTLEDQRWGIPAVPMSRWCR